MLRGGSVETAQVAAGSGAGLVGPGQRIAFCGQLGRGRSPACHYQIRPVLRPAGRAAVHSKARRGVDIGARCSSRPGRSRCRGVFGDPLGKRGEAIDPPTPEAINHARGLRAKTRAHATLAIGVNPMTDCECAVHARRACPAAAYRTGASSATSAVRRDIATSASTRSPPGRARTEQQSRTRSGRHRARARCPAPPSFQWRNAVAAASAVSPTSCALSRQIG